MLKNILPGFVQYDFISDVCTVMLFNKIFLSDVKSVDPLSGYLYLFLKFTEQLSLTIARKIAI
jgi:hypothetical protein